GQNIRRRGEDIAAG
ncbi:hypothetical protein MKD33_11145, partial [Chromobacterium piscinae]